jgi:hypothetical protein
MESNFHYITKIGGIFEIALRRRCHGTGADRLEGAMPLSEKVRYQ